MASFADIVKNLRAALGHPSARSFHKDVLRLLRPAPCSYKAYADIETGRAIPRPRLALILAHALEVNRQSSAAKTFIRAYIRARAGDAELGDRLLDWISAEEPTESRCARSAETSFNATKQFLTVPQAHLLRADAIAFCCFLRLSSGSFQSWTPAELARTLGIPPAKVRAALHGLEASRLVKRQRGGFVTSFAGKSVLYPRDARSVQDNVARIREHLSIISRAPSPKVERAVIRSTTASGALSAARVLSRTLRTGVMGTPGMGSDTGIFVLETSIRKLHES